MSMGPKPPDLSMVDEWAISLVVKEGVKMNLSFPEKIVAALRIRESGGGVNDVRDKLHVTLREAEALEMRTRRIQRDRLKAEQARMAAEFVSECG